MGWEVGVEKAWVEAVRVGEATGWEEGERDWAVEDLVVVGKG